MAPPKAILNEINWRALGARLQAARKDSDLTQKDVADELGVARTTVVAIEKGERRLETGEIVKLSKLFRRNLNDLLRDRPEAGNLAVQFKAYFKKPMFKDEEQDDLQKAAALLQSYCENYLELERITGSPLPKRYPSEYSSASISPEAAADEIATQERARLGLGSGPIADLRDLLETDVGLRIFYLSLPSWMSGLFGYTEALGGCVAINIKHPPERRRVSSAHQYCHFLTQRYRPDVQVTRSYARMPESEKLAEAFARRFLMPESGMLQRLRAHLQATGKQDLVVADLIHLAQYYRVSFEAYVRRLEEMGVVGLGTYEKLKDEKFQVRKAQALLDVQVAEEANEEALPMRYQLLAVMAFAQGEITEGQFAEFLGLVRLEAREVFQRLSGQATLDEEGHTDWTPWSMSEAIPVRAQ